MTSNPDNWVKDAIAAQEEYIKWWSSCLGQVGRPHAYRPHGDPAHPETTISRCIACGVRDRNA